MVTILSRPQCVNSFWSVKCSLFITWHLVSHSRKIVTIPGGGGDLTKIKSAEIERKTFIFGVNTLWLSLQIFIHTNLFSLYDDDIHMLRNHRYGGQKTNVIWYLWLYCHKYIIYLFHLKLYWKGFIAAFNRYIMLHWYTINQTNPTS